MPELLSMSAAAQALGVQERDVAQLLRNGALLGVRGADGRAHVAADFIQDGQVVKHLGGVLTLLRDNGFSDDEAMRWLCTDDPTLPGSPLDALRENRATEVKRRAQALGW